MTSEPYRHTYRVERRTRDLTDGERAIVAERLSLQEHARRRDARGTAMVMIVLFTLAGAVAVLVGTPVHFAVALVGPMLALSLLGARRQVRLRAEASKGPWHAPPEGHRAIETRVFARSVVGAVSGDEDYMHWLLFEVPGGDWFYLDPTCLPLQGPALARAELHVVRLAPGGPHLTVEARGDALPLHGAGSDSDAYVLAMNADQIWRPALDEGDTVEGLVAETNLPDWVRAASRG